MGDNTTKGNSWIMIEAARLLQAVFCAKEGAVTGTHNSTTNTTLPPPTVLHYSSTTTNLSPFTIDILVATTFAPGFHTIVCHPLSLSFKL